jgi:hypothetical protein
VSDEDEWEAYEAAWCGSLERHAAAEPDPSRAEELASAARAHRAGYEQGYRGILGFAVLLLERR